MVNKIYLKWFMEFLEDISMTGYIYLNTSPQKCLERIQKRSREGEKIGMEYLEKCHIYHSEWLNNKQNVLKNLKELYQLVLIVHNIFLKPYNSGAFLFYAIICNF